MARAARPPEYGWHLESCEGPKLEPNVQRGRMAMIDTTLVAVKKAEHA